FSTQTAVSKPFSFSTPAFGTGLTSSQPSLNTGTSSLFSTGATGFGTGGGLFGNPATTGTGLFSGIQQQPQLGMSGGMFGQPMGQPIMSSPPNSEQLLSRLQNLPYGNSPLFQNDLLPISSPSASKFTTDTKTLNQYKVGSKQPVVKRIPANTNKPSSLLF